MKQMDLEFGPKIPTREELVASIHAKNANQSMTGKVPVFTPEETAFIEAEREELRGDSQPQYRR